MISLCTTMGIGAFATGAAGVAPCWIFFATMLVTDAVAEVALCLSFSAVVVVEELARVAPCFGLAAAGTNHAGFASRLHITFIRDAMVLRSVRKRSNAILLI